MDSNPARVSLVPQLLGEPQKDILIMILTTLVELFCFIHQVGKKNFKWWLTIMITSGISSSVLILERPGRKRSGNPLCHWRCFLRHGWRGTCIFASCHCFKETKRPNSKWLPTYFGWLYSYLGYPSRNTSCSYLLMFWGDWFSDLKAWNISKIMVQKMSELKETSTSSTKSSNNLHMIEWSIWFLAFLWTLSIASSLVLKVMSGEKFWSKLTTPLKFVDQGERVDRSF